MRYQVTVASITTALAVLSSANGQSCATINPKFPATFTNGVAAKVMINGLKTPRGIVFDNAGNLLAIEQGGGGVRQIKITDDGTNVCVASSKQIVNDSTVCFNLDCRGSTRFMAKLN